MKRSALVGLIVLGLWTTLSSHATAQFLTNWVLIYEGEPPAPSLTVGVAEPGQGFGFVAFHDDNNDGTIQLPLVPVGSRLALGVDFDDGVEDCDIFILVGSGVGGGSAMIGREIVVPLLTNAAPGGSVGIDFVGEVMAPPSPLNPGDRFTVEGGMLPEWPSLRFVNESGVPDLEAFVQVVDTLPAFSGEVVVSDATLRLTFVPEPSSLLLMLGGLVWIAARRRTKP